MNKFQFIAVVFFLFGSLLPSTHLLAQQEDPRIVQERDSMMYKTVPQDTESESEKALDKANAKKNKKWSHPKKVMVWAMVLPGSGQFINKKYWKMPILYGIAAGLAYFWVTNEAGYREFKKKFNVEYDSIASYPTYTFQYSSARTGLIYTSVNQLSSQRDTYRRYRDFAIAGSIALYAISILDAYVDAHLSTFSLSPDLSMSVKPVFISYNSATFAPGLSLSLKFKNNRIPNNQLLRSDF
jgi:hypothetical protein